ncbi:four helix bundle protein [Algoriphagus sp. H41]|uniref:Four helix bundle protein n=1 Tax=Algoriphagus oliviformis TaxID=2811231 RepID=A0ABS3C0K2_9BACT|nr:four helix bundle protein [Algoriphagus oliviformis]MBN7810435.1 four helix bundle protein [Algoriphagus oliviformis]
MEISSFENLEVWKKGRELRIFVSLLCRKFPSHEKYALLSQTLRASRSITNNIAEGFGRFHFQENVQFCRIARGSLNETLDHLLIAKEENYISNEELAQFRILFGDTLRLLNGYIKYLKSQIK